MPRISKGRETITLKGDHLETNFQGFYQKSLFYSNNGGIVLYQDAEISHIQGVRGAKNYQVIIDKNVIIKGWGQVKLTSCNKISSLRLPLPHC